MTPRVSPGAAAGGYLSGTGQLSSLADVCMRAGDIALPTS